MSQNGGDETKTSSPVRPRHQITRSISEISSPIRLHRHHSHRTNRETERETRTSNPQSAILVVQGRRSFEWARSERATPNLTPSASRRTSILYASGDEIMPLPGTAKNNGMAEGLVKEQQRAAARESGLQRSLADLETFARSTTKQLDDTYYLLLKKLNTLQSTVAALKELVEHSSQLSSSFSAEAEELVTEFGAQLDGFGQFEDQQRRIESLQNRIQTGRELIRSLSERVDAVSERIESWARADREWQERTRKRLKAIWVVTSVAIFLVFSLFIGSQYVPDGLEESVAHIASDGLNTLRDVTGTKADMLRSSLDTGSRGASITLSLNGTEPPGLSSHTPDMLRVFDEL
ncbi:hypothetical protein N657DRAFT_640130 [Parathielavia appendiculata]|uniref:Uncharacterized protein n=1 Tax=Parathielavia appendiculata TaxID=2587402 RepID=A0AAN6UAJ7_9PEZI|nr:hypothetical protein N657DRAFT_640130 [Parathielavia appendiculata]